MLTATVLTLFYTEVFVSRISNWHVVLPSCMILYALNILIYAVTLGELVVTLLKMLTRTRKRVMSSAMRPGTMSGGMRKEIQETRTKRPEGRK